MSPTPTDEAEGARHTASSPPPGGERLVLTTSTGAPRVAALDGFRGIFVTLVLLYHFGVGALVGGWVGINHFFVFSGYLIARLLISERARTGRIRVGRFFRRRAERLVPALVVLVGAVLLHDWVWGSSAGRHRLAGDALATLAWVQNWRLVARDDPYFDLVGDPSPLRHAWTLGVEEQFYVLVPLLVLLLFALARGRGRKLVAVLALAGLSAWWTAHLAADPGVSFDRLYYGTDTRAQALLVGVAVAVVLGRGDDGRLGATLSRRAVATLGIVGTAVSVAAFFVVEADSRWLFTSGGMLLFAAGAALMGVAAVDERPLPLNRLVSWGPLVLLGQMTYGLYLYHWPIHLWLGPQLCGMPRLLAVALQLAVTVAAAWASFRWLELPVLAKGFGALRPRFGGRPWMWPVTTLGVLAVAAGLILRAPVSAADLRVPALAAGDRPFRSPEPPVSFAVLGDSVGASLSAGWVGSDYPGLKMTNLSRIGCDLSAAPLVHEGKALPADPACETWRQRWPSEVRSAGATDLVVLSGLQWIGEHEWRGRTLAARSGEVAGLIHATLDDIERRGRAAGVERVFVVTSTCRHIDATRLDPRFAFFADPGSDPVNIAWVNDQVRAWVTAGARIPGSDRHLLDLWNPLCSNGFDPQPFGFPLYSDTVHFSPAGAALAWTWLAPRIAEPR